MNTQLAAWWRARAPRERLLLRIAGGLIGLVLLPLVVFQAASSFRQQAGADLSAATSLRAAIAELAAAAPKAPPPLPGNDQSLQGKTLAIASQYGLVAERAEAIGPERLRVLFAVAHPDDVNRFLMALTQHGITVRRTVLTRSGEVDAVVAEFEVAGR